MGCFCITPPASQAQRKVYNILVPDIFPLIAPDIKEPIPAVLTRKIAKLEEYIQMNPHKIPKVIRAPEFKLMSPFNFNGQFLATVLSVACNLRNTGWEYDTRSKIIGMKHTFDAGIKEACTTHQSCGA
jgi:hypothetical protein